MATPLTTKTFQFELVSPEKILVSEEVSMVSIPGEAGDFGVLADHAPILSAVRPGVVIVTMPSGEEKKIFVSGGFADVNGKVCAVLAEEALNVNELDKTALEKQLSDLKEDLAFAKDDAIKTAIIQKQVLLAQAKLAV